MVLPLEGIRVVDLTRLLPGPFATQLLADLGADVIKVEDPALGDYMRSVPPPVGDTSYPFIMVNRNKKSVAIDLKDPAGQEVLHRLVGRADVFVEQFRAGVAARLGADAGTLMRVNPRLVYCAFEGFGLEGPYAGKPAHDIDFEALAGILGVTGKEGRPVIPGVPVADLAAGYNAAFSILAGLRRRDLTGKGEFLDVAIFDTAISLMVLNLARYLGTGEAPAPGEILVAGQWAFYNVYETKDGRWLSVAAVEPKFWVAMVRILGLPRLEDQQFAEEPERRRSIEALRRAFKKRSLREWRALFDEANLPWAPVQTLQEVVEDPHVRARGILQKVSLGRLGELTVLRHPARHDGLPTGGSGFVASRGEHTDEVLRDLGYSAGEIDTLRSRGVIGPGGLTRP